MVRRPAGSSAATAACSIGPSSSTVAIGGEVAREVLGVGEGEVLGIGLDEEVERIDHRHVGGEVDLDR